MIILMRFVWPMFNKYILENYEGIAIHRRYVQADTLLFICYCWRSKFITKIDTKTNIFNTRYFVDLDFTLDAR